MEVKAKLRFVRVGPRKAQLVADLIRGKGSEEALNILTFTKKGAAKIVIKLLKSAIANATQKKKLHHAGVSKIEIERAASKAKKAKVTIFTARPGIIIGKKGAEVENLKKELQKKTEKEIFINIQEVKRAEIDAQLVAENVALQLERRVGFRRAMKKAVTSALKLGAKGIKIACGGRLGGAEMARNEWYREGRVPLHTLRADINFG